ncbi:TPA: hypothetical protein LA460_000137 [Clostridium botulinum]|nr:hypothetical protein [Clostridium botulinum]HBJ1652742.1 hypothetical protein [Clostridium botulinum]
MNDMIKKKTWKEFRENGLLFVTNQFLHIFGYSLVYEFDDNNNVTNVYPARVKFRGFGNKQIEDGYKNISKYMLNNAEELEKESRE